MLAGCRKVLLASASLAIAVAGASPAWAQLDSRDAIALQNQISELRRDMQTLRQNGGVSNSRPQSSGTNAPNDLLTSLLDRVSTLEDQQRQLRGQVDQLRNQVQRQSEDLSKQVSDLSFQLQSQGASRPPPGQPSSVLQPSAGAAPPASAGPVHRTPELAMQEGNAALARRDYPAAQAAAKEVLAMPRTPRAVDAQFLLAQSEAGQRNYTAAAPDFYDAYSRSKTGGRAQDALLGVANSLTAMNDTRSACAALDKLRAEFPHPRSDVREAAASARQRANCH